LKRIRDQDFVKNNPTRPIGQRRATNVPNTSKNPKNRQTLGLVCPDCRALQGLAKNRSTAAKALSGEQRLPLYVAETLGKM
jgi:hypothetical protein